MSLKSRWEEYRAMMKMKYAHTARIFDRLSEEREQQAFYLGAEATLKETDTPYTLEAHARIMNMQDEIEAFKKVTK